MDLSFAGFPDAWEHLLSKLHHAGVIGEDEHAALSSAVSGPGPGNDQSPPSAPPADPPVPPEPQTAANPGGGA